MTNQVARLGVTLGINSAEFSKGIEAAKKDLSAWAAEMKTIGVVGTTAFAAMTYKALEFADSIADIATANELTIDTVLKLSEALEQNGGKAENASKMLAAFTAFVDKAATGSFEAQKSFKDIGISLKDIGSMSMEELLEKVFRGLEKMPDTITRNARAMEMFGKGVKGVGIQDLSRQMQEAGHITEVQAKSVKDAGDAWDKLHKITHALMVEFTAFIGTPALNFVTWLEGIAKQAENASDAFVNLGRNMRMLKDFASAFGFAGLGADEEKLKKFAEEYRKLQKIQELGKFDQGNYEGWMPMSRQKGDGRSTKEGINPEAQKAEAARLKLLHFNILQRQKEGKEIEDNTRRVQEAYATESLRQDAIAKTLKDEQEMFVLGLQHRFMRAEDLQLSKDLLDIEQKRNNNIREIKLNTDLNLAAQNDLIDRENRLATEAERLARARKEMNEELRKGTFGQGFQMSMTEYFMNARTEMETGRMAFDSVMGNMSAALDNFARTGKLSFKDLAKSIIQDLIAIQLKASAMSMFKSLGFGFSASGVDNLFKGTANYSGGFGGYAAEGGDISANQTYMVGERGPELFVPKSSGTVIPNNMLGSMGSNQPSITYNGPYIAQMSAIDTQSATQFLSRNKSAVWAANQTAQRALPQSR